MFLIEFMVSIKNPFTIITEEANGTTTIHLSGALEFLTELTGEATKDSVSCLIFLFAFWAL